MNLLTFQKTADEASTLPLCQPLAGEQARCSTNTGFTPLRSAQLCEADSFDWAAHYREKAKAFTSCAATWRLVAHTAQLGGDDYVVACAVTNAIENEALARDAAFKAKRH